MPLILPRRSLLSYPAGTAPGFDPGHPATKKLRFSGIAAGGSFINLTQGVPGVINGTPTYGVDGALGQSFITAFGTTAGAYFSGNPTTADVDVTIAVITKFNVLSGGNQDVFSTASNLKGWSLRYSTALEMIAPGVVLRGSGLSLVANVPYLLIGSTGATTNFLALRLDTGAVVTASTAGGSTSQAPDGTYVVGTGGTGNLDNARGKIAAAMFSNNFMSLPQMLAFAADPWSFWYPNKALSLTDGGTPTPPTATLYELLNW